MCFNALFHLVNNLIESAYSKSCGGPRSVAKGSERQKSERRKSKSWSKIWEGSERWKFFFNWSKNIKNEVVDQSVENQSVEKNIECQK